MIAALGPPNAHRDDATVEAHRRLQVVLEVPVARGPAHESQHEEKDSREDRHDDRLLAALPLPARAALPAGQPWKWDPAGHIWRYKIVRELSGDAAVYRKRLVRRAVPRERGCARA